MKSIKDEMVIIAFRGISLEDLFLLYSVCYKALQQGAAISHLN
jgi:hypothetical protein